METTEVGSGKSFEQGILNHGSTFAKATADKFTRMDTDWDGGFLIRKLKSQENRQDLPD